MINMLDFVTVYNDDGRQPIAIGHLSYSVDLKSVVTCMHYSYQGLLLLVF